MSEPVASASEPSALSRRLPVPLWVKTQVTPATPALALVSTTLAVTTYEPTGRARPATCVKKAPMVNGGLVGRPTCAVNAAAAPLVPGGP